MDSCVWKKIMRESLLKKIYLKGKIIEKLKGKKS